MCYFVNVNHSREALYKRYGTSVPDTKPYDSSLFTSGFTFPKVPVLKSDGEKSMEIMQWGLIPFWVKDEKTANTIKSKTLNARIESADKKASYRHTLKKNRCIIPVKGFFEWQHRQNSKIPWYIQVKNQEIFGIAGLYDEWTNRETGEIMKSFSILTRDANALMAEIHNTAKRMPVVLSEDMEDFWVDTKNSPQEALANVQQSIDGLLRAYTITDSINKRGTDTSNNNILNKVEYTDPKQGKLF